MISPANISNGQSTVIYMESRNRRAALAALRNPRRSHTPVIRIGNVICERARRSSAHGKFGPPPAPFKKLDKLESESSRNLTDIHNVSPRIDRAALCIYSYTRWAKIEFRFLIFAVAYWARREIIEWCSLIVLEDVCRCRERWEILVVIK